MAIVRSAAPLAVIVSLLSPSALAHDCTQIDTFEPNDTCTAAAVILDGFYTELTVNPTDPDFYEITVNAGSTVTIDVLFPHTDGNIDAYLWDPLLSACPDSTLPGGPAIAAGQSFTDNETLVFMNMDAVARTVVLHVEYLEPLGCNEYQLLIGSGHGGGATTIGTSYCTAVSNSTGVPGHIHATGTLSLADNFVRLVAHNLPHHSNVFFLTSLTQGFIPNASGSTGNLCIGGAIGWYTGPGEIMNTGHDGEVNLMVDLTRVPSPTGFLFALPGEMRSFQAWHRDVDASGSATSNFTNGVMLHFVP
ncbi:MAG: hypothetical protein AAGG01_10550 [Planctomycetota bacterium]